MSVSPTATARERLPLWRSVGEAYVLTYRNLGYLFRISWAWVALMFPIGVAAHFAIATLAAPQASTFSWDLFIAPALFWPLLASVAVAWHRKLLEDEAWPKPYYLRLDSTVAGYLGLIVLTSFVLFLPVYAIVVWMERIVELGTVGLVIAMAVMAMLMFIVGIYVTTRLWLALPARALEQSQAPLRDAWKSSRGAFWRIFAGSLLCTAPILVFTSLIVVWGLDLPRSERPIAHGLYDTTVEILVTFLAGMPVVSFLSIAYRQLIGTRSTNA